MVVLAVDTDRDGDVSREGVGDYGPAGRTRFADASVTIVSTLPDSLGSRDLTDSRSVLSGPDSWALSLQNSFWHQAKGAVSFANWSDQKDAWIPPPGQPPADVHCQGGRKRSG